MGTPAPLASSSAAASTDGFFLCIRCALQFRASDLLRGKAVCDFCEARLLPWKEGDSLPCLPEPALEPETEEDKTKEPEAAEDNKKRSPWRWVSAARTARDAVGADKQAGVHGAFHNLNQKTDPCEELDHGGARACFLNLWGDVSQIQRDLKKIAENMQVQKPGIMVADGVVNVKFEHWQTRKKFEGMLCQYEASPKQASNL